jgi:hypothetical protein
MLISVDENIKPHGAVAIVLYPSNTQPRTRDPSPLPSPFFNLATSIATMQLQILTVAFFSALAYAVPPPEMLEGMSCCIAVFSMSIHNLKDKY